MRVDYDPGTLMDWPQFYVYVDEGTRPDKARRIFCAVVRPAILELGRPDLAASIVGPSGYALVQPNEPCQ